MAGGQPGIPLRWPHLVPADQCWADLERIQATLARAKLSVAERDGPAFQAHLEAAGDVLVALMEGLAGESHPEDGEDAPEAGLTAEQAQREERDVPDPEERDVRQGRLR